MARNYSQLDPNQITTRVFDETMDANRVVLVGQELSIDSDKLANALQNAVQSCVVDLTKGPGWYPQLQPSVQPEPVQRVIERVVTVDKPVIEYVDKPVIVEKKVIEVIQVDKPVLVEKIVYKDPPNQNDKVLKAILVVQAVASIIIAISLMVR